MREKLIIIPDFMVMLKAMNDDISRTVMEIQNKTKITYSHVYMLKKALLNKEWIQVEVTELRHNLQITKKGKEVVKVIDDLLRLLNLKEEDIYIAKPRNKIQIKIDEKKDDVIGITVIKEPEKVFVKQEDIIKQEEIDMSKIEKKEEIKEVSIKEEEDDKSIEEEDEIIQEPIEEDEDGFIEEEDDNSN